MTQAPKQSSPWLPIRSPPEPLQTSRFVLEPLHEHHAKLDFEALMSCRARLQTELQWGNWPPVGFTLEENREDLRRHYDEFARNVAFAYTVLSPDRTRCLGCLYLEHCTEVDGAQLAYWVIDEALDIEAKLVTDALKWVHADWSIERVLIPLREENTRGIALARTMELMEWETDQTGPLAAHRCFLSDERHSEINP